MYSRARRCGSALGAIVPPADGDLSQEVETSLLRGRAGTISHAGCIGFCCQCLDSRHRSSAVVQSWQRRTAMPS